MTLDRSRRKAAVAVALRMVASQPRLGPFQHEESPKWVRLRLAPGRPTRGRIGEVPRALGGAMTAWTIVGDEGVRLDGCLFARATGSHWMPGCVDSPATAFAGPDPPTPLPPRAIGNDRGVENKTQRGATLVRDPADGGGDHPGPLARQPEVDDAIAPPAARGPSRRGDTRHRATGLRLSRPFAAAGGRRTARSWPGSRWRTPGTSSAMPAGRRATCGTCSSITPPHPRRHSGRQIPVPGGVDMTFHEPLGVRGDHRPVELPHGHRRAGASPPRWPPATRWSSNRPSSPR